ncbi:MAG: hypothetical protein WC823_00075 [Parcubacteria group bacterium]|jgi:hypothetical protein
MAKVPVGVGGGNLGSGKTDLSVLGDDVLIHCQSVALCLHGDNLAVNHHGLAIAPYVRENIHSPKDPQCKRCNFQCMKRGMLLQYYDMSNKLAKKRAREGFLYNPGDVKTIRSNVSQGIFAFYAPREVAVAISH